MKKQEQTRSSTGGSDITTQVTDSMKKKFCIKQFFFALYHLTRLSLAIAIIVLISETDLSRIKQNKQYDRVQEIIEIWKKVDMITVSTYNCPKGYESYTAAMWPGTKEGCVCRTQLNQYDFVKVLPGQCSLQLINAGCTRVSPQKAIPFVFWRTKKLICLKRIPNLNFFTSPPTLSKTATLTNPPTTLKTCSQNTPHKFTTLSTQPCPITALSNLSTSLPYPLPEIGFSYDNETSYPIADLRISQYEFCAEYGRANISPGRFENYQLEVVEVSFCGSGGDPRVRVVDQVTEKVLFQNNQRIYDIVTKVLPIFPIPNDLYVYKLGTVQYPPWSYQCRSSQQFSLKKAQQNFKLDQAIQKSQTSMYLTIVMLIIWIFLFSFITIVVHLLEIRSRYQKGILFYPDSQVVRSYPNLLPQKLRLSLFCQFLILLLILSVALGLLIQTSIQYQSTKSLQSWLRQSQTCMDHAHYFRQWVSDGYNAFLQNAIRTYLICVLAAVVIVCVDVLYFVWRVNRGDLKDEPMVNVRDIFGDGRTEGRDSDEGLSERGDREVQEKDDVVIEDLENYDDGNEKQKVSDVISNPFQIQDRQKTGQLNPKLFYGLNDQQQSQLSHRPKKHKTQKKPRSPTKPTKPAKPQSALKKASSVQQPMPRNQTEQSFANFQQDEVYMYGNNQPFGRKDSNEFKGKGKGKGKGEGERDGSKGKGKEKGRNVGKMKTLDFGEGQELELDE